HAHDVGRVEQAVGVFLQAEDGGTLGGFVGAHAFEHAHAVVQAVGQHVGGRVAPFHQFTVVPDHTVAVSHRHRCIPQVKARRRLAPPAKFSSIPGSSRCAVPDGASPGTG